MRDKLLTLSRRVREAVLPRLCVPGRREATRRRLEGDPHFEIDEIAEQATREALEDLGLPLAYTSEDRGLVHLASDPRHLFVIDPIDGTRPAMASFESCCFSVAVAPYSPRPTMAEITHALVLELMSGEFFYAEAGAAGIEASRPGVPRLSAATALDSMFWSIELTAHPVGRLMEVYGHLVDGSVTRGAVFVFTSSSFSLTRIAAGQLDAHVDVGHRILRDRPELLPEFLSVGRGQAVTLFPYDIAAAAFIAARAGAVVTDAYGMPLDELCLVTDKGLDGQCSLVAAANPVLHNDIMRSLRWGQERDR
jgi:myo-inositol-1(or 4)-monophosphatase